MKASLQLKRGIWHDVIYYQDEAGKNKQKWVSTGLLERGNKKAAKEIMERELEKFERKLLESKLKIERRSKPKEIDKSEAVMLFSDYVKKYIESLKGKLSPMVYQTYSVYFPARIRDFFDKQKLRLIDVTGDDIIAFNEYLKNAGLKNKTIKHYACVLRPALKQAYRNKLIPDNPYDFVSTIKNDKSPVSFYDKNEMAKLFDVISGHKLELAFKMAAYYGLRRSELLGLRWGTIDFEHKLIFINHKILVVNKDIYLSDQLKTQSSYRTLPLIPIIEEGLRLQKERIEQNKDSYNQKYLDYVFVDDLGKVIYPDYITGQFAKVLKDNNLKHVRLHDLRHSCASIMLANGVQMKQMQEWLGHANFSTTADVYSHLDFSSKIQSAEVITAALNIPTEKKISESSLNDDKLIIAKLKNAMNSLGFKDVNEYLEYLEQGSETKVKTKPEMTMW